jgi:hypothetical protein
MAARKKRPSKVQKKKGAKARPKVKKLSKPARSKGMAKPVAKAKPKRAPVKKNEQPAPAASLLRQLSNPRQCNSWCDGNGGTFKRAKPGARVSAPMLYLFDRHTPIASTVF